MPSSHLLGDSVADEHFRRNAVHFRRIRQLADGVSDDIERDRRRRGKFCGKFCDGGEMAEKDKVREHGRAHNALTRGNMDVFAKVEQMWAGERSLQVLQHGLSPDARRLIELILHAEDDVFDTEVTRELHDEPNNAGKQLLPVSPSKGSYLSVENLFPSNTHCNEIMITLFLFVNRRRRVSEAFL